MTPEVQLALIDLGKAAIIAIAGAMIAYLRWRKEMKRLRKGFLVLADERRHDLWDRAKYMQNPSYSARYMTEGERELLARKDRIDGYRDVEWKRLGKPRDPLVYRKRYRDEPKED